MDAAWTMRRPLRRTMMSRLTVEFPEETTELLDELAQEGSISKREVIRRALVLYNHLRLQGVMKANSGKKLSITNQQDKIERDILFT
jgi:metal-responsive CopG/Arc/MetJ family transcriptional regulator